MGDGDGVGAKFYVVVVVQGQGVMLERLRGSRWGI